MFGSLFETIDTLEESDTKQLIALVNQRLIKHNKKIILFIDNIAELFEQFSRQDTEILREVLSTNNNIRIFGGSAIRLEAFYDNTAPFYQFFKIETLKGLKKQETIALLNKLSEHAGAQEQQTLATLLTTEPEKVESICFHQCTFQCFI